MPTSLYLAFQSEGYKDRYYRLHQTRAQLFDTRKSGGYDGHWRDIADFVMPRRTRFFASDRNRGENRNQNIIDSTAKFAALTLRSGMHAGLTSPARPWFQLSTPDPKLAESHPVKEWLHEVTQRMFTIFNMGNIYNTLPIVYGDLGVFGTAAMSMMGDDRDLFRSYSYPLGSYAIGLDKRGKASTFVRDYELTVRQVVEEFLITPDGKGIDWSKASTRIKDFWTRGQYEQPIAICWLVQPNELYDANRFSAKFRMPFASCHFELDVNDREHKAFLRESGFATFPVMVPRWDITGEDAYGTDCPGMIARGDTRQLQLMQRKKAQLLAKAVDPPLKGPSSLRTQKTSLVQGDITYVDVREGQQGLSPIHEVRLEGFQHITADIQDVRFLIKRAFYEDLFLMMATSDGYRGTQPVTAREIAERHEEKLIMLGPVLERTNDELLNPIIDRTFDLMQQAGLIPEPPDELDQVKLKVEYVSILAQAQKLIGVTGLDRFMATAVPLVEAGLISRHKIVGNQVVDNYSDMLGIDPRIVRSNEDADALAADEAQQAQAAQAAVQAKDLASAAATAGSKPIAPDSALDRMLNSTGSPALRPAAAGTPA